jgi:hypothetical protein
LKGAVPDMPRQVSLNNNSFDSAGITKDPKDAICEYIWNGFEAGATKVCVSLNGEPLKEAMSIVVADNGNGIRYDNLDETFGKFLSSVKNEGTLRIKLSANKGKGRFSYLCFSSSAEWTTTFKENGVLKTYKIFMDALSKNEYDPKEPENTGVCTTGTTVAFPLSDAKDTEQLSYLNMREKLLEEFSWFLYLNKGKSLSLEYMGTTLNFSEYINTELSKDSNVIIENQAFDISIVVWESNVANTSKIYFLSSKAEIVDVQNTSYNKNTVGFYHAVYVSSEYIKPKMSLPQTDTNEQYNQLKIGFPNPHRKIFNALNKHILSLVSTAFDSFLILQADKRLADMKNRGTMPSFSGDEYGKLRKKDFETVTRKLYCTEPKIFHKLNPTQEKSLLGFLNLLLSSEERENVLQIVEQVVCLTTEQRKNFAEVLQRSKLQYIIDAISIIEHRVYVIEQLKKIVFDMASFANERNHIQKIIEQHFWLFGEQYYLLTADKNMKTTLQAYENITQNFGSTESVSLTQQESLQRMDIFLYTQQMQLNNNSEMLIIELKAPSVKLSWDVYNQVVRYAHTIKKEPRFNSPSRLWKFYAVCSIVEEEVKTKYKNFEHHGKRGLVEIIDNFEIYALSWDDVFQSFETRHDFMLKNLKLDYSQVSFALAHENNLPASRETVDNLSDKLVSMDA